MPLYRLVRCSCLVGARHFWDGLVVPKRSHGRSLMQRFVGQSASGHGPLLASLLSLCLFLLWYLQFTGRQARDENRGDAPGVSSAGGPCQITVKLALSILRCFPFLASGIPL